MRPKAFVSASILKITLPPSDVIVSLLIKDLEVKAPRKNHHKNTVDTNYEICAAMRCETSMARKTCFASYQSQHTIASSPTVESILWKIPPYPTAKRALIILR